MNPTALAFEAPGKSERRESTARAAAVRAGRLFTVAAPLPARQGGPDTEGPVSAGRYALQQGSS